MAEIKNYTLNFGFGRSPRDLNFAGAKLAFTEVQRKLLNVERVLRG
jgi:hypothetical protein